MNELQLIRTELAAQRRNAREIAASLTSQPININIVPSTAYDKYLSLIIDLESHRARSHLERLRSRSDLSEAEHEVIAHCARELDALAHGATTHKAHCMTRHSALAEELEAIAAPRYGMDDWRRAAHIDADSILEERRLRKSVLEQIHGRVSG